MSGDMIEKLDRMASELRAEVRKAVTLATEIGRAEVRDKMEGRTRHAVKMMGDAEVRLEKKSARVRALEAEISALRGELDAAKSNMEKVRNEHRAERERLRRRIEGLELANKEKGHGK